MTGRVALMMHVLLLSGCVIHDALPTDPPPAADEITEIRVTSIPPADAMSRTIREPDKIRSIAGSRPVSANGWLQARGRELLPLYRIDFVGKNGGLATWWLGTNNYPARFPCYATCSGWWLSPSGADGRIDATRYRGMTSATYFHFLGELGFWER